MHRIRMHDWNWNWKLGQELGSDFFHVIITFTLLQSCFFMVKIQFQKEWNTITIYKCEIKYEYKIYKTITRNWRI